LLHTITGGEFFSASDTDLDGDVEIWTNDAAAVDGFEKLTASELDFAPTVVLRFTHDRLLDVSAEFQSYFDREIARTRIAIPPQDLEDFKNSDGKLAESPTPASADRVHRLRMVKIKVLEIVWGYLYSGRDQDAWRSLAEMWPPADIDRIRAALSKARAQGIHSRTDGTLAGPPRSKKKSARIFDASTRSGGGGLQAASPQAIQLEFPPTPEIQPSASLEREVLLDLAIDEAGKVRSAKLAERAQGANRDLIESAMHWKFIPAYKNGRAVACRMRIAVSPKK
jgi:hypothetical protein